MKGDARVRRIKMLERRRDHLLARIADYHGSNDSFDRAERAALDYALAVIGAARAAGILEELELAGGAR